MNDVNRSTRHQSALEFLRSRLDYERSPTLAYGEQAFKLDRMTELLARLGDPQRGLPIVHIAGTKGKGSTGAMIAAVLGAAGYRVGVFSSPHLFCVEERMAIDGQPCSPDELVELIAAIEPQVRAMETPDLHPVALADSAIDRRPVANDGGRSATACTDGGPTYFEITTAMALAHFARRKVDIAVLEVGLGGRLDSTNVCQPVISVITSISYDHTKELGDTLPLIAGEKAGIIKPAVPVVSGVTAAEPRDVIRDKCALEGSPLWELGMDFHFDYRPPRHMERGSAPAEMDFVGPHGELLPGLQLHLVGRHQGANAAVALAVLCRLRECGFTIPDDALRRGLSQAACPARIQVLSRRPTVIVDAAHNVASVEALIETLNESFRARRKFLVFATTRDKDAEQMLRLLLPHFEEVLLTRYVSNPRGFTPDDLAEAARVAVPQFADRAQVFPTPAAALDALRSRVGSDDLVCIAGSFFLAADVHRELSRSPLLAVDLQP